jgi:methylated-DNA-[protein]-cysteine S-methyltransferase
MSPQRILVRSFHTPFGELLLGSFGDELCLCDWRYRRMRAAVDGRIQRGLGAAYEEGASVVIEAAMEQLNAYFTGARTTFDVPLRMVGTDFQQRVWQALLTVPFGTTDTYAGLTAKVAEPAAIRAVASANGANAFSIIVPCHRIVGSSGELVGYAGGLPAKKRLLQLEGAWPNAMTVDLFSDLVETGTVVDR